MFLVYSSFTVESDILEEAHNFAISVSVSFVQMHSSQNHKRRDVHMKHNVNRGSMSNVRSVHTEMDTISKFKCFKLFFFSCFST